MGLKKKTYWALKDKILLEDNVLPSTCREVRQFLFKLGIEYKQIHVCKNDFILYKDEYKDNEECPVCKEKRYRIDVQGSIVPNKVLQHMSIIPRLQRMFSCKSLAQLMDWHANNKIKMDSCKFLWTPKQ